MLLVAGAALRTLPGHAVVGLLLIAYGGKLLIQNLYAIPLALLRKNLQFEEVAKIRTVAYLAESVTRVGLRHERHRDLGVHARGAGKHVVFALLFMWRHPCRPKLVFRLREIAHYVRYGLRSRRSAGPLLHVHERRLRRSSATTSATPRTASTALAYWIVLEAVKTIANVVIDVALPTFARLRNDHDGLIAQFIRLTRLNLIAVLPFVILILLVVPEFLNLAYGGGKWSPHQLAVCADAARILCLVGLLRALGFIGPPLLDGIGRPELTLRYMIIATIASPAASSSARTSSAPASACSRSRSPGRSATRSRSRA